MSSRYGIINIQILTKLINFSEKNVTLEINKTYITSYIINDKNPQIFDNVRYCQNRVKFLTESNERKLYLHISKKLMDTMTSAKTYRSILNFLLDNKKSHCIHPRENTYIQFLKESKHVYFNNYFQY